jgi:hypothetical protein
LDEFKEREGRGGGSRSLCAYVYLLLHSLAHQVMHALADVSGLDRDGLGEYLFPADLAFVIYRKGMTPDLGHISAMWRTTKPTSCGNHKGFRPGASLHCKLIGQR